LDSLATLQTLSIQCNRLTKIQGLSHLTQLTELYLSENGIEQIEGLEALVNLRVLDLAANRIKKIENIAHLQQLEEFWANDNQIESFEELNALKVLPLLTIVFLDRNKLQDDLQYKRKVVLALPNLTQLDGFPVMKSSLLIGTQQQSSQ
jgi:protein phosphatase 1 regulatory subunit 7